MADFNKIFVNSSLTVIPASFAPLCFNDNYAISKNSYSITNNILNLLVNTTDTVSIFTSNGIANIYEFQNIRLNEANVILPTTDVNNNILSDLSQNRVLVFVNGKLQPTSTYTVVDEHTLKFNINYTNDYNKLFTIIVYSTTTAFQRITYTADQLEALQIANTASNQSEYLIQNNFTLPIIYESKNTMLFVNEHKVPFNAITVTNTITKNEIQLNIPERLLDDVELFEIIKFTDTNTFSINFTTTQGYLTYGPYDDFGKKIPDSYNAIFRFTDQVKLLIDNIRPGFIIKEVDGYGEALVVDTTFESQEIKCLMIQPFMYSSYTNTKYYVEVPETRSIINYLADFDRKYTFLPEILQIYQRLLLDEINDTIERLRQARSISRVDSVHINKLISLLGFDINIKQLNKKQRRELIEELNEFYRIAGTRNSYNLINILQNNLKLINAEQLFTPAGVAPPKTPIYDYTATIQTPGEGYEVKDALVLNGTGLVAKVEEVYPDDDPTYPGGLKAISLETAEGYKNLNDDFELHSILNGSFNVSSTPSLYSYNWILSDPVDCLVGMKLLSSERTYGIKITGMNGGEITSFDRISAKHNPNEDIYKIDFNKLQLYRLVDNLNVTISSKQKTTNTNEYILYETCTDPFKPYEIYLEPGIYYIEAAGAGGGGGAGDSIHGNEYDLYAENGENGELLTKTVTYTTATTLKVKVGQGGGRVKARGHDAQPVNETGYGNGYQNGSMGELLHLTTTEWASARTKWGSKTHWQYIATYGNIAGGQGGGSSGVTDDKGLILEARGGNGGLAKGLDRTVNGGIGGGRKKGDSITPSALAGQGGQRARGGNFWSKIGGDGWVKIYKVPLTYTLSVNGNTSLIGNNEQYHTVGNPLANDEEANKPFTITAHRTDDTVTFTWTPVNGIYWQEGTYNLKTNSDNSTVKLSISPTISLYDYTVKLNADPTHTSEGSTFINTDYPPNQRFTFVVSENNSTKGTWSPTQGTEKVELYNALAYTREGTGGIISIASAQNLQKNEARCYIDFYKKEELFDTEKGEGYVLEFRSNAIEYGTITEGTPKAPKFWELGSPDVEYGTINETENVDFINYGTVNEKTNGEWVEWWKWDRKKNYYPTNHVDLEMKLPPGVDFSEYVDTFVEQFYNLASTVVFIHQITESFYFGNETNSSYNNTTSTEEDLTGDPGVMTAPFGIVSTAPLTKQEVIITSKPAEYVSLLNNTYTVTINPTPANATVTITCEITAEGQTTQTVLATGTGTQTVNVKYGTAISYKVEASGYVTKAVHFVVYHDTTKYVTLESNTPTTLNYYMLKLNTFPLNAVVTFTTNNITTTNSHSIGAWEGNIINYSVSYPNYTTQTGTVTLNNNTEINITLEKVN